METALILYTQADNTPYLVDLYENENISLNYSFNDIKDLKPRGNFSRTFRIPFTETNAKIFGFVQENTFQFSGFNPKRKINASITVDTIPIIDGYVQFKAAYTSNGEVSDLEIVFFGNVVDFFKTIGDADFKNYIAGELTTDYPLEVTYSTFDTFDSNIHFGLTDRGNKWVGNSLSDGRSIYYDPNLSFDTILQEIAKPYDITPFVSARYIFDKIFSLSGFQFNEDDSTTLAEQLDKMWIPWTSEGNSMVMIGGNGDQAVFNVNSGVQDVEFDSSDFTLITLSDGSTIYSYPIPALNVLSDPGNNISGDNIYTVPFSGLYTMSAMVHVRNFGGGAVSPFVFALNLAFLVTTPSGDKFISANNLSNAVVPLQGTPLGYVEFGLNGAYATLGETVDTEYFLEFGSTVELILWYDDTMNFAPIPANYMKLLDNRPTPWGNEPFSQNTNMQCISAQKGYGNLIDWAVNAPVMKCSEFMSSLFKMFNLAVIPDDVNQRLLTLKPIQEYLGEGSTKDWSNKLDISKDITLMSTADFQSQKNLWTYKQSNDYLNNIYNSQGDRVYGRLELVDPENDFATSDYKVESLFFPSPCALISNTDFAIPKYINDSGTYVAPGARILYKTNDQMKVDIYDNETNTFGAKFFYLFNHYTSNIPTLADEDLNFGQEISLQRIESQPWKTLYARYWNDYIADIYAPDARILEGFFALEFADIYQFKYNDQIFIKDAYWRILEISDYVVGMQDSVKVKLIKIVSATPDCLLVPDNVMNSNGTVPFLDSNGDPAEATESCCKLYGYLWVNDNCFAKVPDGKERTLQAGNDPKLTTRTPIKVNNNSTLISTPNNVINKSVIDTIVYGTRNVVERQVSNSLVGGTDAKAINRGITIGSGGDYAGEYQSGIIQLTGRGDFTNDTTPITITNTGIYITMPDDCVWYAKLMLTVGQINLGIDGNGVVEFNLHLATSAGVLSIKDAIIVSENLETFSGRFEFDIDISGLTFAPRLLLKNDTYPQDNIFVAGQLIYNQFHYE
jgi:hypothetical protein